MRMLLQQSDQRLRPIVCDGLAILEMVYKIGVGIRNSRNKSNRCLRGSVLDNPDIPIEAFPELYQELQTPQIRLHALIQRQNDVSWFPTKFSTATRLRILTHHRPHHTPYRISISISSVF